MMFQLPTKIPRPTNKKAILLAQSITTDPQLVRVPVIPEETSIKDHCFINVENIVKQKGGLIVYGWQIWDRQFFIEAGFHAIWKKDNKLIDITPKIENEILFFEDLSRRFEGYRVDNIRKNYTGNPLIDDLIKLYEILFMIESWGKNRYLYDPRKPITMKIPEQLAVIREDLRNQIIPDLLFFIQSGGTQETPCFCRQQIPYDLCHGKYIKGIYDPIRLKYADSMNWG